MKIKTVIILFLAGFVGLCTFLVAESGLFAPRRDYPAEKFITLASETSISTLEQREISGGDNDKGSGDFDFSQLSAIDGIRTSASIGSVYADSGYKFELELTSKGAGIARGTLSEFTDLDREAPQPLEVLSPIAVGPDKEVYSMANGRFVLVGQKQAFPLDKLNWRMGDIVTNREGRQSLEFEAILKDASARDIVRLKKTYHIMPESHQLECTLTAENLSDRMLKVKMGMQGPAGIGKESHRGDMRAIVSAFLMPEGNIESAKLDAMKLRKAKQNRDTASMRIRQRKAGGRFIWAATTNKYFAAILRPVPQEGESYPRDVTAGFGEYYDPGLAEKRADGDESISFSLHIPTFELAAGGEDNSKRTFEYQLYLGPKDREVFDKNELYKRLAYFHAIDFRSCFCCPASIIRPMAFGIMALMKGMYQIVPNYGVVIIILVFLMRLVMHPVTKKSQVSMMRMQKLAPMMEEIKKKYANNKAEMNKHVMALYREQGVSPFASMLPMMVQMPVWIALWTAVYASIDLRGAPFLPFWITNLSAPDALIRFKAVTLPIFGPIDSFNLLPILMGVVMFLQQKLMPHAQTSAQTNPQVAQQQKMMMIMLPLMFPIMLYKGPSGVNLYIMSSIGAGVIEQMVIRKHLREKDAAESTGLVAATSKTGGKTKKKKPKPFYRY